MLAGNAGMSKRTFSGINIKKDIAFVFLRCGLTTHALEKTDCVYPQSIRRGGSPNPIKH